jgi:hypothetical protein
MERDAIPAPLKRAVLVEAGHRCAIPTCHHTTTELAHIIPWAQTKEHTFDNLIALCPNCHTRFDTKGEIDRKAMKIYKQNLGFLNNRYGELERRVFEVLAQSNERVFVVGAGSDILLNNAVKDGLFEDKNVYGLSLDLQSDDGFKKSFPLSFTYWLTDAGVEFIKRYAIGDDLS